MCGRTGRLFFIIKQAEKCLKSGCRRRAYLADFFYN